MENILGYTIEQIEKMTQNYLLSVSEGFIRIEKFIKMFAYTNTMSFNNQESIEVRVKVTTEFGKIYTEKVFIHPNKDTPYKDIHASIVGYGFKHKKLSEMLEMDLIPNTVFTKSFEEAKRENDELEAKRKHRDFVNKISMELNYNIKQKRKATAAKRSYKKYSVEQLEEILPDLTDVQQNYLQQIIEALKSEDTPKQTIKQYIATFTGVKRYLFEEIEKSFEAHEEKIFNNVLLWLKTDKDSQHLTEAQMILEAQKYIENQKWNLFKAVVNYLGNLDIINTKNIYFRNTNNGFEGEWILTLSDGSIKDFTTKSIIAEGLIQRAHYRYLINLK